MIKVKSSSSSSVLILRLLTNLQPAALQAVAASGNSQASEGDMQQLRMQLGERDAEVQQLRSEVTALKVCNVLESTLVRGSAFTSGEADIQTFGMQTDSAMRSFQAPGVTPFAALQEQLRQLQPNTQPVAAGAQVATLRKEGATAYQDKDANVNPPDI